MSDPTPEQLEREFPGWHVWHGVSGLFYARRPNSSPPIVLNDENTTELRAQMAAVRARLAGTHGGGS